MRTCFSFLCQAADVISSLRCFQIITKGWLITEAKREGGHKTPSLSCLIRLTESWNGPSGERKRMLKRPQRAASPNCYQVDQNSALSSAYISTAALVLVFPAFQYPQHVFTGKFSNWSNTGMCWGHSWAESHLIITCSLLFIWMLLVCSFIIKHKVNVLGQKLLNIEISLLMSKFKWWVCHLMKR